MSTGTSDAVLGKRSVLDKGVCFAILSSSDEWRANEVYNKYIKPACGLVGYRAQRSNELFRANIVEGVTNALSCAPMAVAYLGAPPWDANVMLQIGYRLSNQLPLVYLRDKEVLGKDDALPSIILADQVVSIPVPRKGDSPRERAEQAAAVKELVEHIQAEQMPEIDDIAKKLTIAQLDRRYLDSVHAVAWINVRSDNTESTSNLIYIAASKRAEDIFGIERRLVGRTMAEFMSGIKRRMPRAQWAAFRDNQRRARKQLRGRAQGKDADVAIATIPIYFENHENDNFNGRAYLPIIVKDFQPQNSDWYSIAVLYLDVTSVTELDENRNIYVCRLDTTAQLMLEPLPNDAPVNVFISYNRRDQDEVEQIFSAVKEFFWSDVVAWMDLSELTPGDTWTDELIDAIANAEAAFIFIGPNGIGEYQQKEIDTIKERGCLTVPVVLAGANLPSKMDATQAVFLKSTEELLASGQNWDDYCETWLGKVFAKHFPNRVPG